MIDVYKSAPLAVRDGIPAFSTPDRYTDNYEQISRDHLQVFEASGRNPFMSEAHWRDCEDSTAVLIERYAHDGELILDVGVGMGRLLGRFPKLRRYGMDISEGYLRHAKEQGIEVCYSRIEDMPYKQGVFDVVTCTDVLEHVFDLNLAVSHVLSVLKPGGIFIMRVPYREDLSDYLVPDLPYEFVHLRNFDEFGITLLAKKIFGHEVLEQTFAGHRAGKLKLGGRIPKLQVATKYGLDVIDSRLPSLAGPTLALRRRILTPTSDQLRDSQVMSVH